MLKTAGTFQFFSIIRDKIWVSYCLCNVKRDLNVKLQAYSYSVSLSQATNITQKNLSENTVKKSFLGRSFKTHF